MKLLQIIKEFSSYSLNSSSEEYQASDDNHIDNYSFKNWLDLMFDILKLDKCIQRDDIENAIIYLDKIDSANDNRMTINANEIVLRKGIISQMQGNFDESHNYYIQAI